VVAKKTLLELLHNALESEEKSIPVYTKHLQAAITWAVLPKKKLQEIQKIFFNLGNDSITHKSIVEKLIKKIEEDPRNAF